MYVCVAGKVAQWVHSYGYRHSFPTSYLHDKIKDASYVVASEKTTS